MDKITRQIRIEHWTQIMNECLNSGMNKTEWCRANGISDNSFIGKGFSEKKLLLLRHQRNFRLLQTRQMKPACERSHLQRSVFQSNRSLSEMDSSQISSSGKDRFL